MPRPNPRLDLTLPDGCRQVAEFCAEFPHYHYEDIERACRDIERSLREIARESGTRTRRTRA